MTPRPDQSGSARCPACQAVTDAGKPTRCQDCPSWDLADDPSPQAIWLIQGSWYTLVVRAPDANAARALSAEGGTDYTGWSEYGLTGDEIRITELVPSGEPAVLAEHTG